MKKIYLLIFALLATGPVMAQEDIPLFDDEVATTPNLGRGATPLKELTLTPKELPDIRISLDDTRSAPAVKPETPTVKPAPIAKTADNKRILLNDGETRVSNKTVQELSAQLDADRKKYEQEQAEKARAEAAKKAQEAKAKKAEPVMPESVADIFGKLHDVSAFDISGAMLGMTPEEAVDALVENGYTVTKVEHKIPLHRTSYYDTACRQSGARRADVIRNCIRDMADDDEVQYISSITLARPESAEYMQVLFSSYETGNLAYKIFYENKGDNSLALTRKNLAKKIRRRDAFWKMIYDTYGYPDDKDNLVWGDVQKAYMQARMQGSAYNAYIMMEDAALRDSDLIETDTAGKELRYRVPFTFAPRDDED